MHDWTQWDSESDDSDKAEIILKEAKNGFRKRSRRQASGRRSGKKPTRLSLSCYWLRTWTRRHPLASTRLTSDRTRIARCENNFVMTAVQAEGGRCHSEGSDLSCTTLTNIICRCIILTARRTQCAGAPYRQAHVVLCRCSMFFQKNVAHTRQYNVGELCVPVDSGVLLPPHINVLPPWLAAARGQLSKYCEKAPPSGNGKERGRLNKTTAAFGCWNH